MSPAHKSVFLFYNSWQLAIVAVVVLVGALYPLTTVKRKIKSVMDRTIFSGAAVMTHYNEAFTGNRVVSSFNLDEATSALDNKSEEIVQQAIYNLMADRTVFVIAHRLSTVKNADCIVVIDHGEIKEQGTHEELLARENSVYAALYKTQLK